MWKTIFNYKNPSRIPSPPDVGLEGLLALNLGDVVQIGQNKSYTLRGRVHLDNDVGGFHTFLILGDMTAVIGIDHTQNIHWYDPHLDGLHETGPQHSKGFARFWPQNAQALETSMSDIFYQIALPPKSEHPVLIVNSGKAAICFESAYLIEAAQVHILSMPRHARNKKDNIVQRESWIVSTPKALEALPLPGFDSVETSAEEDLEESAKVQKVLATASYQTD